MKFILNYKYGSPVAKIKGGIDDNKIIYLLDEDDEVYKNNFQITNEEEDDILGLFFHALKKAKLVVI